MRFVIPIVLASLACPAFGQNCAPAQKVVKVVASQATYPVQTYHVAPTYSTQAYAGNAYYAQAEVIVPTVPAFIVAPFYVPLYAAAANTANYVAPTPKAEPQTQSLIAEKEILTEILGEMRSLRKDVDALKAGKPTPYPQVQELRTPKVPPMSPRISLATKCASCHAADVSERKGESFTMFDADDKLTLTAAAKRKAREAVEDGHMPKGKPLTPEEKVRILTLLK
jgi:hypothetical protein